MQVHTVNNNVRATRLRYYQCPRCPQQFVDAVSLHTHTQLHALHDLASRELLKPHRQPQSTLPPPSASGGRKRHQCHLCLKFFSQSSGLRSHLRTHAGIRPYQCQAGFCNSTVYFTSKVKYTPPPL